MKFLMPCKPIAPHLLSIHMAEVEVLPQCHHLMRIPQLYKSLQMPIHHPLPGQKYPCQVTSFTIQTAESGATFTINGLCISIRQSLNAMKVLARLFLLPPMNLPKAFVSMDKALRSFAQTYFLPTLPISF